MCTLLYLKWITNSTCIARGTLLNIMWQPGWEGALVGNGNMYMYGWVPSLLNWNYHNIVNWLYDIKISKKKTKNDENRILGKQSLSERMIEQRKVIQADLVLLNFTLLLFASIVFFKNWWFAARLHWANLLESFFFQQHFPHLCLSITVILRIFQTF